MEGESVVATVTVTNTGSRDADEVVQLYVRDLVSTVSRPVRELKGFERIHLKAGEQRDVQFVISRDLLGFYNHVTVSSVRFACEELQWTVEPGDFQIMVGPNSRDLQKADLRINN